MNLNDQKIWLLNAIDKAIKSVYTESLDVHIDWDSNFNNIPHIEFKVPGGPTFRIVKSKQALRGFRELVVRRWPSNNERRKTPNVIYRKYKYEDLDGVEYIREYKPQKLTPSHYGLNNLAYKGDGWFGDGCYLLKGEPPPGLNNVKWRNIPLETLKDVLSQDGYRKAQIVCEYRDETTLIPLVVISLDKFMTCVQAVYLDIVKQRYRRAEPYVVETIERPILFIQDEQIVGVIMPLRIEMSEDTERTIKQFGGLT